MSDTIPRMRTAAGIVAELKAMDPDTGVTEYFVRRMMREGVLPVVRAGSKTLVNLDDVLALLHSGTAQPDPTPTAPGGIRRLDVKLR